MEYDVLLYATLLLIIALLAGLFALGGIAAAALGIPKVLVFVIVLLFVVRLVLGLAGRD